MDARRRRRRRRTLIGGALATLTGPPSALIAVAVVVAAAGVGTCTNAGSGPADAASPAAQAQIPSRWLQVFQQVGAQYRIPWEILAGIAKQECDFAKDTDPSCTPQAGATGPGKANYAGASGPMQIGVGGAAGNEYQSLQEYLPDPQLGPHDPTTAVQLAALVLIKHKGAPQGAQVDAYLPYVVAYNGSGPEAQAYGQQVLANAHRYQGAGSTAISAGCAPQPAAAGGYSNPLAKAPHVIAERIDMGVDYADPDPEPIGAIAAGTVTYAGPQAGGWQPNCVNYTLTQPSTPTEKHVYVCEHITPTVHTGQTVQPGQQIASFIAGGGIETGWAAAPGSPVSTRAAQLNQQAQTGDAGNNRTYCGQTMSNLIQQAGGTPGLAEGRRISGGQC
jgi:hypothetical protein